MRGGLSLPNPTCAMRSQIRPVLHHTSIFRLRSNRVLQDVSHLRVGRLGWSGPRRLVRANQRSRLLHLSTPTLSLPMRGGGNLTAAIQPQIEN